MIKQWFRLWDFLSFTLYLRSDKGSFLAPMDSSSVPWAIHNFSKVHNLIACFDTSYYRPSLSDQDVLVTLEIVLLPRFESNLQHAPSSSSNLDSNLRFYDQSSKSNWVSVSFYLGGKFNRDDEFNIEQGTSYVTWTCPQLTRHLIALLGINWN